jgi:hypothetical protein
MQTAFVELMLVGCFTVAGFAAGHPRFAIAPYSEDLIRRAGCAKSSW